MDNMTHDTCTRLASCCCRKSPAEKAIQVHTGQMSSKTLIIGLSIFRCGNECTSQINEDFSSWCKLKTFRRSLHRISTYWVYILFPNLSSSLERRRKRTLRTRLSGLLLPRVRNILKLVYQQESEQSRFFSCQPSERMIGPVLVVSNCTFSSVAWWTFLCAPGAWGSCLV